MHRNRVRPTICLLAVCLLSACRAAGPQLRSELAGRWQGTAMARSTQHKDSIVEDYQLVIGPDGRMEGTVVLPYDRIARAGQTLTDGPVTLRVLRADYQPTSSEFAYEFSQAGRETSRSGSAWSARLLPDGRLDVWLYSYEMSADRIRQSESLQLRALMHRVTATQPARE
ncbi:MAG: hypothetical protein PHU85_16310 [Phycisphaerae bacterium]|nr:hypothetical protein [Phycisphaerae bacterium]